MPLQSLESPGYIKRTKVFANYRFEVDETGDFVVPIQSDLQYQVAFKDEVQNVVGVELRSHHVRTALAPTMIGRYRNPYPFTTFPAPTNRETNNGNHVADVQLTNLADPSIVVTLAVDMDLVSLLYTPPNQNPGGPVESLPAPLAGFNLKTSVGLTVVSDLFEAVLFHLNLLFDNHPNRGDFGTDEFAHDEGTDIFHLYFADTAGAFTGDEVKILFRSGASNADSMHAVLGFDQVDTTPDAVSNGARAPYVANLRPFRFIDVSILELPEFRPHSRIFMDFDNFTKPTNPNPRCMRLLTRPLQRLSTFTVLLTVEGLKPVSYRGSITHELEFEVLSIEPSINVPGWVKQRLTL
jgi:hypothetical protein